MILVYFASGGCVDDVVHNRTNDQIASAIVVNCDKKTRHQRQFFNI